MANEEEPRDPLATKLAYLGYALSYSLIEELEERHPGTWKRVWTRARDMLQSYQLDDAADAEWLNATIEKKTKRGS
jgi:hypothetical protein